MELKLNTGNIFKNDATNEKAPAYKGKVNVNGKVMEVSLWVNEGKKGKYFSAKFQEPYVKAGAPQSEKSVVNEDDGMPF